MEIDRWCDAHLSPRDVAFLRTFQPTITVPLAPDATLLCFHGSPRSNTEIIVATTPDSELDAMLAGTTAAVLAGGHTHEQMLRRHKGAIIMNPGSVGLPFERTVAGGARNPPWAEYALVEWQDGALTVMLRRVPYDVTPLIGAARRGGMPHAEWWVQGWLSPA
jgi:hypothetical protein